MPVGRALSMRHYHLPQMSDWLREGLTVFVVLAALLAFIAISIPLR